VVCGGVYEVLKYARVLGFTAGRSLILKIWRLLELEWKMVVKHSYRETNKYADVLANNVCFLNFDIIFFESC
jgi:hypothetical protein